MVVTWPGHMKPFISTPPESMRAFMAGGVSLWRLRTDRFSRPLSAAVSMVAATVGAVVSKPTAKKTTSLSGFFSAISTVPRGEYTTRMSPPRAFSSWREVSEPGTFIMSPKVAIMTSLWLTLKSIILFMSPAEVTHTGHPGPEMRRTVGGRASLMPYRAIVWVWVPQISMMLTFLKEVSRIFLRRPCAWFLALNSSMYFISAPLRLRFRLGGLGHRPYKLVYHLDGLKGLFLVHLLDGEARVDYHVVAQPRAFKEHEARLFPAPSHVHRGGKPVRLYYPSGYAETHLIAPSPSLSSPGPQRPARGRPRRP